MKLHSIKSNLEKNQIFHSESEILNRPTVIGYEKRFKWRWIATQLNTFIIATNFGDEQLTSNIVKAHLTESFTFSKNNTKGWPRGLQSCLGAISILISSKITDDAKEYCKQLKSSKKWAGFSIPIIIDSSTNEIFKFEKSPIWGWIYYSYFIALISKLIGD